MAGGFIALKTDTMDDSLLSGIHQINLCWTKKPVYIVIKPSHWNSIFPSYKGDNKMSINLATGCWLIDLRPNLIEPTNQHPRTGRADRDPTNTHPNYSFIAPIWKAINTPLFRYNNARIIATRDGLTVLISYSCLRVNRVSIPSHMSVCQICPIREMRVEPGYNFLVYTELTESTFLELHIDMFFCSEIYMEMHIF